LLVGGGGPDPDSPSGNAPAPAESDATDDEDIASDQEILDAEGEPETAVPLAPMSREKLRRAATVVGKDADGVPTLIAFRGESDEPRETAGATMSTAEQLQKHVARPGVTALDLHGKNGEIYLDGQLVPAAMLHDVLAELDVPADRALDLLVCEAAKGELDSVAWQLSELRPGAPVTATADKVFVRTDIGTAVAGQGGVRRDRSLNLTRRGVFEEIVTTVSDGRPVTTAIPQTATLPPGRQVVADLGTWSERMQAGDSATDDADSDSDSDSDSSDALNPRDQVIELGLLAQSADRPADVREIAAEVFGEEADERNVIDAARWLTGHGVSWTDPQAVTRGLMIDITQQQPMDDAAELREQVLAIGRMAESTGQLLDVGLLASELSGQEPPPRTEIDRLRRILDEGRVRHTGSTGEDLVAPLASPQTSNTDTSTAAASSDDTDASTPDSSSDDTDASTSDSSSDQNQDGSPAAVVEAPAEVDDDAAPTPEGDAAPQPQGDDGNGESLEARLRAEMRVRYEHNRVLTRRAGQLLRQEIQRLGVEANNAGRPADPMAIIPLVFDLRGLPATRSMRTQTNTWLAEARVETVRDEREPHRLRRGHRVRGQRLTDRRLRQQIVNQAQRQQPGGAAPPAPPAPPAPQVRRGPSGPMANNRGWFFGHLGEDQAQLAAAVAALPEFLGIYMVAVHVAPGGQAVLIDGQPMPMQQFARRFERESNWIAQGRPPLVLWGCQAGRLFLAGGSLSGQFGAALNGADVFAPEGDGWQVAPHGAALSAATTFLRNGQPQLDLTQGGGGIRLASADAVPHRRPGQPRARRTPSDGQYALMAAMGLQQVRQAPMPGAQRGDCFFASFDRLAGPQVEAMLQPILPAGQPIGIADMRNAVADYLIARYRLEGPNSTLGQAVQASGGLVQVAREIRTVGADLGNAADLVPLLAADLFGVALWMIEHAEPTRNNPNPQPYLLPVGSPQTMATGETIWMVRTRFGGEHFIPAELTLFGNDLVTALTIQAPQRLRTAVFQPPGPLAVSYRWRGSDTDGSDADTDLDSDSDSYLDDGTNADGANSPDGAGGPDTRSYEERLVAADTPVYDGPGRKLTVDAEKLMRAYAQLVARERIADGQPVVLTDVTLRVFRVPSGKPTPTQLAWVREWLDTAGIDYVQSTAGVKISPGIQAKIVEIAGELTQPVDSKAISRTVYQTTNHYYESLIRRTLRAKGVAVVPPEVYSPEERRVRPVVTLVDGRPVGDWVIELGLTAEAAGQPADARQIALQVGENLTGIWPVLQAGAALTRAGIRWTDADAEARGVVTSPPGDADPLALYEAQVVMLGRIALDAGLVLDVGWLAAELAGDDGPPTPAQQAELLALLDGAGVPASLAPDTALHFEVIEKGLAAEETDEIADARQIAAEVFGSASAWAVLRVAARLTGAGIPWTDADAAARGVVAGPPLGADAFDLYAAQVVMLAKLAVDAGLAVDLDWLAREVTGQRQPGAGQIDELAGFLRDGRALVSGALPDRLGHYFGALGEDPQVLLDAVAAIPTFANVYVVAAHVSDDGSRVKVDGRELTGAEFARVIHERTGWVAAGMPPIVLAVCRGGRVSVATGTSLSRETSTALGALAGLGKGVDMWGAKDDVVQQPGVRSTTAALGFTASGHPRVTGGTWVLTPGDMVPHRPPGQDRPPATLSDKQHLELDRSGWQLVTPVGGGDGGNDSFFAALLRVAGPKVAAVTGVGQPGIADARQALADFFTARMADPNRDQIWDTAAANAGGVDAVRAQIATMGGWPLHESDLVPVLAAECFGMSLTVVEEEAAPTAADPDPQPGLSLAGDATTGTPVWMVRTQRDGAHFLPVEKVEYGSDLVTVLTQQAPPRLRTTVNQPAGTLTAAYRWGPGMSSGGGGRYLPTRAQLETLVALEWRMPRQTGPTGNCFYEGLIGVARQELADFLGVLPEAVTIRAVREALADFFAADYIDNPGFYAEFGIGNQPGQTTPDAVYATLSTMGEWAGEAGEAVASLATRLFGLNLGVVNEDGTVNYLATAEVQAVREPVYLVRVTRPLGHFLAAVPTDAPRAPGAVTLVGPDTDPLAALGLLAGVLAEQDALRAAVETALLALTALPGQQERRAEIETAVQELENWAQLADEDSAAVLLRKGLQPRLEEVAPFTLLVAAVQDVRAHLGRLLADVLDEGQVPPLPEPVIWTGPAPVPAPVPTPGPATVPVPPVPAPAPAPVPPLAVGATLGLTAALVLFDAGPLVWGNLAMLTEGPLDAAGLAGLWADLGQDGEVDVPRLTAGLEFARAIHEHDVDVAELRAALALADYIRGVQPELGADPAALRRGAQRIYRVSFDVTAGYEPSARDLRQLFLAVGRAAALGPLTAGRLREAARQLVSRSAQDIVDRLRKRFTAAVARLAETDAEAAANARTEWNQLYQELTVTLPGGGHLLDLAAHGAAMQGLLTVREGLRALVRRTQLAAGIQPVIGLTGLADPELVRRDISALARRFGDDALRADRLVELLAGAHIQCDYALLHAAVRLARGIYLDWRRPDEVIGLVELVGVYRLASLLPPAQRSMDGLRVLARELLGLAPKAPVGRASLRELAGAAAAVLGPLTRDALRTLLGGLDQIPPGTADAVRANVANQTGGAFDQGSLDRLGQAIGLPLEVAAGGHVHVGRLVAVVAATRRAHIVPGGPGNVTVPQLKVMVRLIALAGGARWADLVALAQEVHDTGDDMDAAAIRELATAAGAVKGPLTVEKLRDRLGIIPADPVPAADPATREVLQGLLGGPLSQLGLDRIAGEIGLVRGVDGRFDVVWLDNLGRLGRQLYGSGLTVGQLRDVRVAAELVLAAAPLARRERLRRDMRAEDLLDFAAESRHDPVIALPDHAARALVNAVADHVAGGGVATVDGFRTSIRVSHAEQAESEVAALSTVLEKAIGNLPAARWAGFQARLRQLDAALGTAMDTAGTAGLDLAEHLQVIRRLHGLTELIADVVREAFAAAEAELPETAGELEVNDPMLVAENLSRLAYPPTGDASATHADLRALGREFGLTGDIAAIDPRTAGNLVALTREVFVESTATPAGRRVMVTVRQVRRVQRLIAAAGLDPARATFADLMEFAERIDQVTDPARSVTRPAPAAAARLRELADRAQRLADGGGRVSLATLVVDEMLRRHQAQWDRMQRIRTGLRDLSAARPLAWPLTTAAETLTGEIQAIADAVAGGAVTGELAARIAALPARFAALVTQAHDAVLAEVRRLNAQADLAGLEPAQLDGLLNTVSARARRGGVAVGEVRARFRSAVVGAALARFGPAGELGRRFAAELGVSTRRGGPARTLPLDPLRALQASAVRADTDHEQWMRQFRAAVAAVRAQLDGVRADIVAIAAGPAAGKFDLPRGAAFGFAHAMAWLELNQLAAVRGVGLVGLGRQVGIGNQDTVKGLSITQPVRYVRRLGNTGRLAVEITGGGPLTLPLLESVRRLADAIRTADPTIGDNVTEADVDRVIRWVTDAAADYLPTQTERDHLRRLADRAKTTKNSGGVTLDDIRAQWRTDVRAARDRARAITAEVTAARRVLDLAVRALDGDARDAIAAARDELARNLARHTERVWLSADAARLAALETVRRRAGQLVQTARTALRRRATDGLGDVAALLDELARRGGDPAELRGRLATLRTQLGPPPGPGAAFTAATAGTTIEVLRGLAALRVEAAAAVIAVPRPPADETTAETTTTDYPPEVYGDGFGRYLDLAKRIFPTATAVRRRAVATVLAAADNRGRLRELATDPQHEITRRIGRGLGWLRRFTGEVYYDATLTEQQLAAYVRGRRLRPGVWFGTAARPAEADEGTTVRFQVSTRRGRDAGVLLSRPDTGRDVIVLDPDVEYEVLDNRLDPTTGIRHIRLRQADPIPAPPTPPRDYLGEAFRAARQRGDRKVDPYPDGGPPPLPKLAEDDENPPGFRTEIEFTFGSDVALVEPETPLVTYPTYTAAPDPTHGHEEHEEDDNADEDEPFYEPYVEEGDEDPLDREEIIERNLQNIADELYVKYKLTSVPHQAPMRRVRQDPARYWTEGKWLFATDATVGGGELISWILLGAPEHWAEVDMGLGVLRHYGGSVDETTGGHIHFGTSAAPGYISAHARLLRLFKANEDVVYRLSNDPTGSHERRTEFAWPNSIPASGYASITTVERLHRLQLEKYHALNFRYVVGEPTDHVEVRTPTGNLELTIWQIRVVLFRAMFTAALDPALDERLDEMLAQGQPLGTHHTLDQMDGGNDERDLAALRQFVDLLPLTPAERILVAQLFAATTWLPAPTERPGWYPERLDAWVDMEQELFPELTVPDPVFPSTHVPTTAQQRVALAGIRAALREEELPAGRLAELWGSLGGALGE
ncbi:MAG TPA: hypothetical protein VGR06_03740, partial [Actinophytocola sp.]|nr:hypothetical protein [Actinophytocola sp.]